MQMEDRNCSNSASFLRHRHGFSRKREGFKPSMEQVPPAVDRYHFGRAGGGLVRRGGYTGRAVELRAKNNHSYTLDLLLAGPDLAARYAGRTAHLHHGNIHPDL